MSLAHLELYIVPLSYAAMALVALLMVPKNRDPDSANAWLLIVLAFPWVGLPLYLMFGHPWMTKKRWAIAQRAQDAIRKLGAQSDLKGPGVELQALGTFSNLPVLATELGGCPAQAGSEVKLFDGDDEFIPAIVADIDSAKHHVHLLYYIFLEDKTTSPLIEALIRAAKRGVVVRVLVDCFGSSASLFSLVPKLQENGVRTEVILPVGLFRFRASRIDLRNHRKLCVIDGEVAHAGSGNLVDKGFKPNLVYHELNVRCLGSAVRELQAVFLSDWYTTTDEMLGGPEYFPELTGHQRGIVTQVLPSGPTFKIRNNLAFILALLYAAKQRVIITSPYFIPDSSLLLALQAAVVRKVQVDLITSVDTDHALTRYAQRSFYAQLLSFGVQIHEYTTEFLHAKCMTVDGEVCFIGSSNFDIRSFTLNEEVILICYDKPKTLELVAIQESYLAQSIKLSAEEWDRRGVHKLLAENVCRLVSPLL